MLTYIHYVHNLMLNSYSSIYCYYTVSFTYFHLRNINLLCCSRYKRKATIQKKASPDDGPTDVDIPN